VGRAALLFALILSGCSGLKTYPNALDKNATIHVRTDGGTLLSRTGIALDLYTVDPGCGTQYLGTLELDDSTIELGLPLHQQVRLAYVFSRDALVGTSGTTVIELHTLNASAFHDTRTFSTRVLQKQLIEATSVDVVGVGLS